jgi:peroxin-4
MPPSKSSSSGSSSSRSAIRRLLKELDTWTKSESANEQGIERLGPVRDDELLNWEAVINGRGVGGGYESMYLPPSLFLLMTLFIHPSIIIICTISMDISG